MSSASARLPASQCASRKASTRCGVNTSAKRACSVVSYHIQADCSSSRTVPSGLDHDPPRHVRMDRAKIVDGAHLAEGVGKSVASVERIGREGTVLLLDHMDHIVLVFPRHRGADMHGQGGWS